MKTSFTLSDTYFKPTDTKYVQCHLAYETFFEECIMKKTKHRIKTETLVLFTLTVHMDCICGSYVFTST